MAKTNDTGSSIVTYKEVAMKLRRRGINVSGEFEKLMNQYNAITKNDAIGVLRLAMFWQKVIDDEDFPNFVTKCYEKFYRIGTVVVNSNPYSEGFFIGNKAKLKEYPKGAPSLLDDTDITTIMSKGYRPRFKATAPRHIMPELEPEF